MKKAIYPLFFMHFIKKNFSSGKSFFNIIFCVPLNFAKLLHDRRGLRVSYASMLFIFFQTHSDKYNKYIKLYLLAVYRIVSQS